MESVVWDLAKREAERLGITTSRYVALVMEASVFSLEPRIKHPLRGLRELRDIARMTPTGCTGTKLIIKYARAVARSRTHAMDRKV